MKFKIVIAVFACVVTASTQCSLTERLAAAHEKIKVCRKNFGVDEASAKLYKNYGWGSNCKSKCKSCSNCQKNV